MNTTTFNSFTTQQLRTDLESALKTIQDKYGIKVDVGSFAYTKTRLTSKITLQTVAQGEPGKTLISVAAKKYLETFKIVPGGIYKINGEHVRVIDYNSRCRRYPVVLKRVYGTEKETKCSVNYVLKGTFVKAD